MFFQSQLKLLSGGALGLGNLHLNNQTVSFYETFVLNDNVTESLPFSNITQLSVTLNETISITDNAELHGIPQNHSITLPESFLFQDRTNTKHTGTIQDNVFDYRSFSDDILVLLNNKTIQEIVPPEPEEESSKLFSFSILSDLLRINYTDGDLLPNATESWQFENGTDNVDLNGDATIDDTEGINGTSLLLDGDLDFAQTNSTNSTTYIEDMSIAAWVKPNYTNGSPEFTVVSKGKSFALTINNIIEPQHIA